MVQRFRPIRIPVTLAAFFAHVVFPTVRLVVFAT